MLRPLWESREHYEELKQLDDAMKEVKVAQRTQAGESETGGQAGQRAGTRAKFNETRDPDAALWAAESLPRDCGGLMRTSMWESGEEPCITTSAVCLSTSLAPVLLQAWVPVQ